MQNLNLKFKSDLNERCVNFSLQVISLVDTLPSKRSSWVISDQLIRAACSVGANLVEGRASSSRLEFKKFYEIALKSANETRYWLDLLVKSGLAEKQKTLPLIAEVGEIANMLAAGVLRLKSG